MSRSSELQRHADRYLGIPLTAILRPFVVKRPVPDRVDSIGIIQPSAIGDTILCSGLLAGLRTRYPNARIHVFHGRSNSSAVSLLKVDLTSHVCDFSKPLSVVREIRRQRVGLLLDLTPWPRLTALIAYFSGAACVAGYRTPGQYRHWLYDIAVDHLDDRHELDNLAAMRVVVGAGDSPVLAVKRPTQHPNLTHPLERLVLIHTQPGGSRARAKRWPEEYWAEVARTLCDDGWHVGLTGVGVDEGPVDSLLERVDRPERCFSLCNKLSFVDLAALLLRAPLLITVDTGILHLASALDANVLALHGPTASTRWGARNPKGASLDAPHPSRGYLSLGFERHPDEFAIMQTLSPATVLEVARRILHAPPEWPHGNERPRRA
jgi:ADP-heptose:LPS heptosyltransferase